MAWQIVEEAWSGNISGFGQLFMPSEGKTLLAREYAKCKNRPFQFYDANMISI
jgi:hypothetical protein